MRPELEFRCPLATPRSPGRPIELESHNSLAWSANEAGKRYRLLVVALVFRRRLALASIGEEGEFLKPVPKAQRRWPKWHLDVFHGILTDEQQWFPRPSYYRRQDHSWLLETGPEDGQPATMVFQFPWASMHIGKISLGSSSPVMPNPIHLSGRLALSHMWEPSVCRWFNTLDLERAKSDRRIKSSRMKLIQERQCYKPGP